MLAVNWLSPRDLIDTFGTAGLLIVVFVESGLIPFPLPGDSILFLAGAFCATSAHSSDPHLNLAVVVLGSFVAAVSGAQLGYALGHRYGTRLFKADARVFKVAYLERAQEFFDERGPRSVVLARFIPFVRTVIPILGGTGRMPARKFAAANVVGALIWAVGISLLGFWLGKSINIDKYIYPIVAVIIILSLIPPFLEYRKHRRMTSDRG
jgi:membrane-associated protein